LPLNVFWTVGHILEIDIDMQADHFGHVVLVTLRAVDGSDAEERATLCAIPLLHEGFDPRAIARC
jgi:hypothetical protein